MNPAERTSTANAWKDGSSGAQSIRPSPRPGTPSESPCPERPRRARRSSRPLGAHAVGGARVQDAPRIAQEIERLPALPHHPEDQLAGAKSSSHGLIREAVGRSVPSMQSCPPEARGGAVRRSPGTPPRTRPSASPQPTRSSREPFQDVPGDPLDGGVAALDAVGPVGAAGVEDGSAAGDGEAADDRVVVLDP